MLALVDGRVFTGDELLDDHAVLVDREAIRGVVPARELPPPESVPRHSLSGDWLAPGFIDTQVNGGGGVLFNAAPRPETIATIGAAHRRFGTTAFLPTLISDDRPRIREALAAVREAMARPPGDGAEVLGVHLEGPHLALERRGIHPRDKLRPLEPEDLELLRSLAPPARTLVTLAPEVVPIAAIRELTAAGVIVAAGHTAATYQQTRDALRAGVTGFTHLFNAMRPLASREPGVVGAALEDEESFCGIIADGIHVHPAMLRLAIRAKARDRWMLVTDAMPPVGGGEEEFLLDGVPISVEGGRLSAADGTLAGSVLDMATAVRNAVTELRLPPEQALRMASLHPARFLGLDRELGRIAVGYRANLVRLDSGFRVKETWVLGRRG